MERQNLVFRVFRVPIDLPDSGELEKKSFEKNIFFEFLEKKSRDFENFRKIDYRILENENLNFFKNQNFQNNFRDEKKYFFRRNFFFRVFHIPIDLPYAFDNFSTTLRT